MQTGTRRLDSGSHLDSSLVTLTLTVVFAYMAVTEKISQDFMTVYAVVIAFYFGTQSQKVQDAVDGEQK